MAKAKPGSKTTSSANDHSGGSHLGQSHWRHRAAVEAARRAAQPIPAPKSAEGS